MTIDFSDFKDTFDRVNAVEGAFKTIENQIDLTVTALDNDEQEKVYESFDKVRKAVNTMLFDMVSGYCYAKLIDSKEGRNDD